MPPCNLGAVSQSLDRLQISTQQELLQCNMQLELTKLSGASTRTENRFRRNCMVCNASYDDVYYLHHKQCEEQSHHSMRGDEYTRRLRLYYRTLRRGTDNPRLLDPSALIINVLQSLGTHLDASQSSRIEPPSSTRTPGASLADSLLAYIADMTGKEADFGS